jgi:hypothetical protein
VRGRSKTNHLFRNTESVLAKIEEEKNKTNFKNCCSALAALTNTISADYLLLIFALKTF